MIIREDVDIGHVVIGDVHKKSRCAELRLGEVIDVLAVLRRTQLDLVQCGLGLQEPTDDIVEDVLVTHMLVGEITQTPAVDGLHTPRRFVAEVEDAMRCEGLEDNPIASHQNSCSFQPTQPPKDNNICSMTRFLHVPLSSAGLLCTMHSKNPCTPTDLQKNSSEGPWFQRTPALSLTVSIPIESAARRLELQTDNHVSGGDSLCSAKGTSEKTSNSPIERSETKARTGGVLSGTPPASILSDGVEGRGIEGVNNTAAAVDKTQDDVISKTTQPCDGRYQIRVLVINVGHSPSHVTCYASMCERDIYVFRTNCFAIVLYRLEDLVNTIVANAGGGVCPSFDITFNAEFCKLDWEYDIQPLTNSYGEISNHMFDWIRTWLNPQLEDVKCYVCSPYLVPVLTGYCDINSVDRYEHFVDFVHDKYAALPSLDITTIFVPYTCGKHWTLYALGPQGFFHFDSMAGVGFHFDVTIRKRLAKLWASRSGYADNSVMWQRVQSSSIWIQPNVPQQTSGWACGYYVVKNIMEFTHALRHNPKTLREVSCNPVHKGVVSIVANNQVHLHVV